MPRNLFRYHPRIGYLFIPRLRARVRHEGGGYLVRTNPQGFRSEHDFAAPARDDRLRIAVFGDSYTAGEGVSNGYRFTDLLEQQLPGVEILNFAIPGTGTDQQFLTFREFAPQVRFDLVLVCAMVENITRNLDSERLTQSTADGALVMRPKPYFVLEGEELRLRNQPVPKQVVRVEDLPDGRLLDQQAQVSNTRELLRRMNRAVDRRIPGFREWTQRLRRLSLPAEYRDPQDPAWLLMRHILAQWVEEATMPVVICPLPDHAQLTRLTSAEDSRQRFREFSRDTGSPLIDLLPTLWGHGIKRRRLARFARDDHPNRLGHRLLADALRPRLEELVQQGVPS